MGHTPGPWEIEDRRGAPLKNVRIVSGYKEVAQVSDVHQRDPLAGYSHKDAKAADALDALGMANARLIAAAPDLLEAAEAARNVYELFLAWGPTDDGTDAGRALEQALTELGGVSAAAIAKARRTDNE